MVVVEDKDVGVVVVAFAADALVAGTERAISDVGRYVNRFVPHRLADPGTVVSVGGDHHPLFTQRMPALFPDHGHAR